MSDPKPIAQFEWNLRSIEKTITIDDAPEPTRKPAPVVVVPEPSDARKGRLRSAGVDNERLIAFPNQSLAARHHLFATEFGKCAKLIRREGCTNGPVSDQTCITIGHVLGLQESAGNTQLKMT
jgi:hypothetical protein